MHLAMRRHTVFSRLHSPCVAWRYAWGAFQSRAFAHVETQCSVNAFPSSCLHGHIARPISPPSGSGLGPSLNCSVSHSFCHDLACPPCDRVVWRQRRSSRWPTPSGRHVNHPPRSSREPINPLFVAVQGACGRVVLRGRGLAHGGDRAMQDWVAAEAGGDSGASGVRCGERCVLTKANAGYDEVSDAV